MAVYSLSTSWSTTAKEALFVAILDTTEVQQNPTLVAQTGEQLETEYQLHELPTDDSFSITSVDTATVLSSTLTSVSAAGTSAQVLVEKALLSRIEFLEAENKDLKLKLSKPEKKTFSVEGVAGNDDLVRLYTGFTTYSVFLAFYEFLGPSVNELTYRSHQSSQPAIFYLQ